jgi:cbb3-type cytochrome oxidase maturation protein
MSVLIVLILASLVVGLTFLIAFIWSVRSGQYEDTLTPSMRMLLDDATVPRPLEISGSKTIPLPVSVKQTRDGQPTHNHGKTT